MIRGISHITLIVRDLGRATELFGRVLDAQTIYDSGEHPFSLSKERFLLVGGVWIALMEGEPRRGQSYDHIAFRVAAADLNACRQRIEALGLNILPDRPRIEGEGESLYFYDFDGHLFELHAGDLPGRLAAYAAVGRRESPQPQNPIWDFAYPLGVALQRLPARMNLKDSPGYVSVACKCARVCRDTRRFLHRSLPRLAAFLAAYPARSFGKLWLLTPPCDRAAAHRIIKSL